MLKIPDDKLREILINEGLITKETFDELLFEAKRMNQEIGEVLVSKKIISEDYLYEIIAKYYGLERVSFSARPINEKAFQMLPKELAQEKKAIIFDIEKDGTFDVAMEDPTDLSTIEFLKKYLNGEIKPFLAKESDLRKGFSLYGKTLTKDLEKIIETDIKKSIQQKAKTLEEAASLLPIVSIIDTLLFYAISLKASDIHLEIFEDEVLVRLRIDGVLHEVLKMPKEVHLPVVARIKLLAELKIDEHQKPQDGRFRHKTGDEIVDIRVSVVPTIYGEKVVMRLLPITEKSISLKELGMSAMTEKIVKENIEKTYGMILVTGPTGSGKSTTLYSILSILNKPEVNIITIEDPVEYRIKYVNQIQVNPRAGLTFATGLRSILRQDPNIIMVGEIRDTETAEIAVHSALTGHLLLSTLHTNDAPTAVPRLMDMGIPSFLVAAVLNMVVAQRLVRKICLNCIVSFKPDNDLINSIKAQLQELKIKAEFIPPKTLYKGRGCSSCNFTGYSGRTGIYEILNVDEQMRELILSPDFSLDNLTALARSKGMISMFEDGLNKAKLGVTTIEEVLRVIRE